MFEWKSFKEEKPEDGRMILYGNHRALDIGRWDDEDKRLAYVKKEYKDVTHWCYLDYPPMVEWVSNWT